MRSASACISLIVALLSHFAAAQNIHGNLTGRVVDARNTPVEGATVVLSGPDMQGSRGAITNDRGQFKIFALPIGVYEVQIQHVSYTAVVVKDVVIHLGKTTDMGTITTEPEERLLDEVVINWEDPVIDPTTPTISGNLEETFFTSLPTDRDYLSTITLLPRVNASPYGDAPNISGATGSDNVYWVNGINVTDPNHAGNPARLPFNFVREIEVLQNGFQAEYGRSLGGIVNVITHSGTNNFESNAFGFFTNDFLTGEPREVTGIDKAESDFKKYDVGLAFKGPIIKDKLWYNLAYNYINTSRKVEIGDFPQQTDRQTDHIIASKYNWSFWNNTLLEASVLADVSHHDVVGSLLIGVPQYELINLDPALSTNDFGSINTSLNLKKQISRSNFLEGAFYYSHWWNKVQGQTETGRKETIYVDHPNASISGGRGGGNQHLMRRLGARINNLSVLGSHKVKYGLEAERNALDVSNGATKPGMLLRQQDFFHLLKFKQDAMLQNTIFVAYIQDSWAISRRINLHYGLRWEGQYLQGDIDSAKISISDQWQPRVGIIFNPGIISRNKVFGTFGRYYAQFPLNVSSIHLSSKYNASEFYHDDPREPGSEPYAYLEYANFGEPPSNVEPGKLHGEYADEFTLGYHRVIKDNYLLSLNGIYRETKNALLTGYHALEFYTGNPGRGILHFLPDPRHTYKALEISVSKTKGAHLTFQASYVLSYTEGNYTGFFDHYKPGASGGLYTGITVGSQAHNCDGYLANDHRHNFKITARYDFQFGLSLGTYFNYLTGAPLNEFGQSELLNRMVYLVPRGTAGRMPDRWDLDLRLLYDLKLAWATARIYVDLYNVGNPREVANIEQIHYTSFIANEDGSPARDEFGVPVPHPDSENPSYMLPLAFQPPMRLRFGLEIMFDR